MPGWMSPTGRLVTAVCITLAILAFWAPPPLLFVMLTVPPVCIFTPNYSQLKPLILKTCIKQTLLVCGKFDNLSLLIDINFVNPIHELEILFRGMKEHSIN